MVNELVQILLKAKDKRHRIFIQTHTNPDMDAVASAYGLQQLLKLYNIETQIIYNGVLKKPDILKLINKFNIQLNNLEDSKCNIEVEVSDYIIYVDCQANQNNVLPIECNNILCIDHHAGIVNTNYLYKDVQSDVGACASIIYSYCLEQHLHDRDINTALYCGLLIDTDNFNSKMSPIDDQFRHDMRATLKIHKGFINELRHCKYTTDDINIIQRALAKATHDDSRTYLVVNVDQCEQNILGTIADFLVDMSNVNIVLCYCKTGITRQGEDEYRFSIRSYDKFIIANKFAENLSHGLGGGGGHQDKAGGTISAYKLKKNLGIPIEAYLHEKIDYEMNKVVKIDNLNEISRKAFTSPINMIARPRRYLALQLCDYFEVNDNVQIMTNQGNVLIPVDSNWITIGLDGNFVLLSNQDVHNNYEFEASGVTISKDKEFTTLNSVIPRTLLTSDYVIKSPYSHKILNITELLKEHKLKYFLIRHKETSVQVYKLTQPTRVLVNNISNLPYDGTENDYLVVQDKTAIVVNYNILSDLYKPENS